MKKLIAFKIFLTSFNLFSSITKEQSIILTSYTYPGSLYWEKVIEMGEDKILYVIINPSSGPGEVRDENYVKQIEKIKKSNIKIIAYIPTNYQKRSINTVYKDIEKYFEFYGKENLNGFFFDEIGVENKNEVEYLKELNNHVKNISNDYLVVSNPGRQITDEIAPHSDIFVTSEISGEEYINKFSKPKSKFENDSNNYKHIYHIIYDVKPKDYKRVLKLSRERNAGWIMITDAKLPNPYDKMPSNFSKLVDIILKK